MSTQKVCGSCQWTEGHSSICEWYKTITITERERDTIIAALRLWQEINNPSSRRFYALNFKWRVLDDIATNGGNHDAPLDENEIDILIEDKINR